MKQRYEIPLPLDEVKERLRADMQTDWPLGKLLRSVKRPANDRRGLYGQIEGERLWAVMMRGYDMYPKRVFFGTLLHRAITQSLRVVFAIRCRCC